MVAAALLLLVIVAPSKGAPSNVTLGELGTGSTGLPAGSTATGTTGTTGVGTTTGSGATASGVGSTGTGSTGTSTGSGSTGSTTGSGTTGRTGTTTSAGSTTHCVHGKNFAVTGFVAAPPCQPTFTGNNGGATTRGVTAKQIEIVYYQPEPSLALKAILGPAGLYPSPAQINDYLARAVSFMDPRWQFYGRKLHIDDFISQSCAASPPSDSCFRQDAQTLVTKYHPFAVIYPRNLTAPGMNQELSQLGVVNFGGAGMPLSFDASQQPYHWDYDMDGDQQAEIFGEFYCKELAGRKATFAGSASLQSKVRTAEILVDDSPEQVQAAQHLQAVIDKCDPSHGATIKSFSPNTAQAVVEATTVASQAKQAGITTLLYYTDPVAPVYFTPQLNEQQYYPENVLVGSGYLDFDPLGQLYNSTQWKDAFGLGDLPNMGGISNYDASAVYRSTKGSQSQFLSADNIQSYLSEVGYGIQQAGPDLTPATFQHAMLTQVPWGGTQYHPLIKFGQGDYTGVSDVRIVYWDASKTSPVNGKKGSYVALDNGHRYGLGQIPSHPFTR
jgi:hypothetical protein